VIVFSIVWSVLGQTVWEAVFAAGGAITDALASVRAIVGGG
jgi:hypothetical protein